MRFTTGTLEDLSKALIETIDELRSEVKPPEKDIDTIIKAINELLVENRSEIKPADKTLESAVSVFNSFMMEKGVRTKFTRIGIASASKVSTADTQMRIIIADGTKVELTKAQVSVLSADSVQSKEEILVGKSPIPDIWFHKNRNGRWAIATGQEPAAWPEDETEE